MYGRRVPRGLPRGPMCAGIRAKNGPAQDARKWRFTDGLALRHGANMWAGAFIQPCKRRGAHAPRTPRAALIGSAGLFLDEDEGEAVVVELQGDGVGGGADDLAAEVAESEGAS